MASDEIPVLHPFIGDGRLHVRRVVVEYTYEAEPELWKVEFDLERDDRIGAIFFDRDDLLRCVGFNVPSMAPVGPKGDPAVDFAGMSGPTPTGERAEREGSAREIYVHDKKCDYVYIR